MSGECDRRGSRVDLRLAWFDVFLKPTHEEHISIMSANAVSLSATYRQADTATSAHHPLARPSRATFREFAHRADLYQNVSMGPNPGAGQARHSRYRNPAYVLCFGRGVS
jgi:hypothetical protein